MIKLSTLKEDPGNPRKITDADFNQLVESLRTFPKMMELSPFIIDENSIIKRGHQRKKALLKLGYTEIPDEWVKRATDFTPQQLREFMLKDNSHSGEFDWEILKTDWNTEELLEWGFELPEPENQKEDPPKKENVSFQATKTAFIKIVFKNAKQLQKAEGGIKTFLEAFKGAEYTVSAGGKL